MPSPFPGMDPYLEDDLWTSVHAALATIIAIQLGPLLRPKYVALPSERFIIESPDDVSIEESQVYPDVGMVRSAEHFERRHTESTALLSPPLQLATVLPSEVPHKNVEIRDVKRRRLVTAIEILSPTNKRGSGRREYLEKRHELLASPAHLLEIDLNRKGSRVPMRKPLPKSPYFVLLSRANKRPILDVWPVGFREPLPSVPVPLLAGDADVSLDLQKALTDVYDSLGYEFVIDYTEPPEPALPAREKRWAEGLIRKQSKKRRQT
jgi:hypothetical protein